MHEQMMKLFIFEYRNEPFEKKTLLTFLEEMRKKIVGPDGTAACQNDVMIQAFIPRMYQLLNDLCFLIGEKVNLDERFDSLEKKLERMQAAPLSQEPLAKLYEAKEAYLALSKYLLDIEEDHQRKSIQDTITASYRRIDELEAAAKTSNQMSMEMTAFKLEERQRILGLLGYEILDGDERKLTDFLQQIRRNAYQGARMDEWLRILRLDPSKEISGQLESLREDALKYRAYREKINAEEAGKDAIFIRTPKTAEEARKAEKASSYEWRCPSCQATNIDSRKSFVVCTQCGRPFDEMPNLSPIPPVWVLGAWTMQGLFQGWMADRPGNWLCGGIEDAKTFSNREEAEAAARERNQDKTLHSKWKAEPVTGKHKEELEQRIPYEWDCPICYFPNVTLVKVGETPKSAFCSHCKVEINIDSPQGAAGKDPEKEDKKEWLEGKKKKTLKKPQVLQSSEEKESWICSNCKAPNESPKGKRVVTCRNCNQDFNVVPEGQKTR